MKRKNRLVKIIGMALLFSCIFFQCKAKAAEYTIEKEEAMTSQEDGMEYTLNLQSYDSWEEAAAGIGEIAREFGVKREHQSERIHIPVEITINKKIPEIEENYSEKFNAKVREAAFREETGNPDGGHILRGDAALWTGCMIKYKDGKYTGTYDTGFDFHTPLTVYRNFQEETTQVLNSLNLDGKSDYEKCLLIEEWVGKHITYKEKSGNTFGYCPAVFGFFSGTGVCMHYADLFYYMATKAGLKVLEDSGWVGNTGHAWNLVMIDGFYYYTDPTTLQTLFHDGTADVEFLYGADDFDFYKLIKSDSGYEGKYPIADKMYSKDHSVCNGNHDMVITGGVGGCYPGTIYSCKNCHYEYCDYTGEEDHEYMDGKVIQEADCTHEEITFWRCRYCRNVDYTKVTAPALGHDYQKEEIEPTCTKDGYYRYTCSRCQDTYTEPSGKAAKGHEYEESIEIPVSCTKPGRKAMTCKVCGDKYTETISATGHDYQESDTIPPTCIAGTTHVMTCTRCGTSYQRVDTDKADHEWVDDSIVREATCTTKGSVIRKCKVCGKYKTSLTPATGHKNLEVRDQKEATCTEAGYTGDTYCKDCGTLISKGKETEKTEHTFDEGKIIKAATYTETGVMEYTCEQCGTKRRKQIPKLEHTHDSYKDEIIQKATCTELGTVRHQCTECEYYYDTELPATGHKNLEIRDQKEATCTEDGYTGDTYCKDCGLKLSYGKVIDKIGHKFGEGKETKQPTYMENGTLEYTCERCGATKEEEIPKLAHTHDSYEEETIKEATCTEPGTIRHQCTECEYYYDTEISATGHGELEIRDQKEPTCSEEGYSGDSYCKTCGALVQEGEKIARTKHQYGTWKPISKATALKAATRKHTCTICGASEIQSYGKKLKAYVKVNTGTIKLRNKQSTGKFVVTYALGDSVVKWKSSNTKIAKISGAKNGKCKITAGKKTGKCKITIVLKSGAKKSVIVKVQKTPIAVEKLQNVPKKVVLKRGQKYQLKPVIAPFTASGKVTYKTANKKIATVSTKGMIKGKKKGSTKITVQAGRKAQYVKVVVK